MNLIMLAETSAETPTIDINWKDIWAKIFEWLTTSGVKLVLGVVVLFILFKIINRMAKIIKKRMTKKNVDKTITSVIYNLIRKGLKLVLFILFLGYVGIDTAGIGTIIASFGVAIGLALQGSLSNLAGGLIILVMRPFKIGDYIDAQGQSGTVEEIGIFYTYLVSVDNKVIMIPNGPLANGSMINYSLKEYRRVDITFSISYANDFTKAKEILLNVINNIEQALSDPAPFVKLVSHGESSINIATRVWTKNSDYWTVYFAMMENAKTEFDKAGIEIPYNQLDVHIKNE